VLLKHPDECKIDRTFSTQWRVRTERYVAWTDDAWSVWSPDGMARRPDVWNSDRWTSGRDGSIVQTANRDSEIFYLFRSAKSSEKALIRVILVYSIFTHK